MLRHPRACRPRSTAMFRKIRRRAGLGRLRYGFRSRSGASSGMGQGGRGFILVEKALDIELAEVRQGRSQRVVTPVPPRKVSQPIGDLLWETSLDRPCGVTA